ncbi:MAG: tryptophan--tRNA ligase [Dehalococcoidia bacterium]
MSTTTSTAVRTAEEAGAPAVTKRKRVLSGIQPSGNLHIGNYLGAIRRWVAAQDEYENFFCIVDLHAMTLPWDPSELREHTRQLAAIYLASGIDPERSAVFVQSRVPAHAELAWILNCVTPLGWLYRMTQFKTKSGGERETVSAGLLDYPVLMASDILLYHADAVPVGSDQKQHVELTRDIAQRFNQLYGDTFTMPEPLISDESSGARIMGLDDPTVKMSKSNPSPAHSIRLLDPPDTIVKKLKRATTDSGREVRFDRDRPGVFNLLTIYRAITGEDETAIQEHFAGKGYGDLKQAVADVVVEALNPLQARYRELTRDREVLDAVLAAGAARAAAVANPTLEQAKRAAGLL